MTGAAVCEGIAPATGTAARAVTAVAAMSTMRLIASSIPVAALVQHTSPSSRLLSAHVPPRYIYVLPDD